MDTVEEIVNGSQKKSQTAGSDFGDRSIIQITTRLLNERNFLRWSQSVKLFIRGCGKIEYLTGAKIASDKKDPAYAVWDAENSMIISWLVNPDIGQNHMFLPTAKAVWDSVSATFSDLGNSAQVYEVKTKIRDTKQGDMTVNKFYNRRQSLWQELDQYYDLEWSSIIKIKKMLKRIEFLGMSLYQQQFVRCFQRSEGRKTVMLGSAARPTAVSETSALQVVVVEHSALEGLKKNTDDKARWCDYCNKPRHTREICWKLHGKPSNCKGHRSPEKTRGMQALIDIGSNESFLFNKEQFELLKNVQFCSWLFFKRKEYCSSIILCRYSPTK
ncbi:hypothetical protein UlMin_042994 [Ulmus minor]